MKIDKNIPIPPERLGRTASSVSRIPTIHAMEIGDSVLFDNPRTAHSFAAELHHHGRTQGFKSRFRKTDKGWRVWKIGTTTIAASFALQSASPLADRAQGPEAALSHSNEDAIARAVRNGVARGIADYDSAINKSNKPDPDAT